MSATSKLTLRIFDGTRQLFSAATQFLVTITDGNQKILARATYHEAQITFDLPFYDNFGDNYAVVVYAEGYRQAGFFPVKLSSAYPTTLDLMLIHKDPGFNFSQATWDVVSARYPFLAADTDDSTAKSRYENLMETEPVLACLLNLCEAMSQIRLPQGTPLDYLKQVRWDIAPAQDRLFAYCDPRLLAQVQAAAAQKLFAQEPVPSVFHAGATRSWKQVEFGEANVQLTFHENAPDHRAVNGLDCLTVEPDIDYYKDLGAHTIFEVVPNGLTHSLTDPIEVYVLRWIAGRHAGVPEFNPLYTLTG